MGVPQKIFQKLNKLIEILLNRNKQKENIHLFLKTAAEAYGTQQTNVWLIFQLCRFHLDLCTIVLLH